MLSPKPRMRMRAGTIAIGGVALASSSNGSSVRLSAREAPVTSPIAIPIAAPIAKPAASRFRLSATSVEEVARRPDLPRLLRVPPMLGVPGTSPPRAPRAPRPRARRRTRPARGAFVPLVRRPLSRPPDAFLAAPVNDAALSQLERNVDRVAENGGEEDSRVQLGKLERQLLPLHVRADPFAAEDELRGHARRGARSTRSP